VLVPTTSEFHTAQEDQTMRQLIHPPEVVHVDLGHLHTATEAVRRAALAGEPFRREVIRSATVLSLLAAAQLRARLDTPGSLTVPAAAELVWWLAQGAEEIGHEHGLSPVGLLFNAVDHLGVTVAEQAPRTDQGLVAVVEAEVTCAIYEHVIAGEGQADV
jgi:hypothetical protein